MYNNLSRVHNLIDIVLIRHFIFDLVDIVDNVDTFFIVYERRINWLIGFDVFRVTDKKLKKDVSKKMIIYYFSNSLIRFFNLGMLPLNSVMCINCI